MEVIKRTRQKCGKDFPIEYRISGDELLVGGMKIDQTVEFVKMIEDSIISSMSRQASTSSSRSTEGCSLSYRLRSPAATSTWLPR